MNRWVLLLAAIAGARALFAWRLGWYLEPDAELYAQGGVGLFPSPLGRLVGVGGLHALGVLNVVANVLLVLAVARGAELLGGRGWVAALVFNLAPLGVWSMFVGVDAAAAAALVAAMVWGHGRPGLRLLLLVVGVMLHPALLLVVVAYLVVIRPVPALWLTAAGMALALATPYRGIVLDLDPFRVLTAAAITAAFYALTLPAFIARSVLLVLPAVAGGSLAAGLVASSSLESNCRYLLPAVAIGSLSLGGGTVLRRLVPA